MFAPGMGGVCMWHGRCLHLGVAGCLSYRRWNPLYTGWLVFPWLQNTSCFLILLAVAMPFPGPRMPFLKYLFLAEALNPQLTYCL